MSWIKINSKQDLPSKVCECWVVNSKGVVYQETYFYKLGGFIYSSSQSIRDYSNRIVGYYIIEKPDLPNSFLLD